MLVTLMEQEVIPSTPTKNLTMSQIQRFMLWQLESDLIISMRPSLSSRQLINIISLKIAKY